MLQIEQRKQSGGEMMQPFEQAWFVLKSAKSGRKERREMRREQKREQKRLEQHAEWEAGREERKQAYYEALEEWENRNQDNQATAGKYDDRMAQLNVTEGTDARTRQLIEEAKLRHAQLSDKPEPPSETNPFE